MKNVLSLITMLLVTWTISAQTYTSTDPTYIDNVKAGEAALNAAKYDSCLIYYAMAFEVKETSVLSTLRAAACAYSNDSKEILDTYLSRAYDLNWDMTKQIFEQYDEFRYLDGSPFVDMIQNRWQAAAKASGIDMDLMAEFAEIQRTDQEQRGYMREVQEQYGWDSPQMDSLWKIQNVADEANLKRIEEVIALHGYPGKSLVGPSNMGTAFLVIQHSNQEAQEKYLPLLKQAADDGELRWSSVALLIDRVLLGKGEKQIYGSQIHTDKETGEYFFGPIAQPFQIDSIRQTVGLGPLQAYADNWDFIWDPEAHVKRHEAAKKLKGKED